MVSEKLSTAASPILLSLIIADVVSIIAEEYNLPENDAIEKFYASKTYEILENEKAKLWWLSSQTLFGIDGFIAEKELQNA